MSSGLFSSVELDSDSRAGYRLHHLEVLNWGTFDGRIWRLTPAGETTLLTGDIGSGKSTLVDAMTTLLLPANRISYNKAAGADTRERTLRSYVEGHYKSERVEASGASRAIGMRDQRSYSVVLGVFVNDGYDETVTLAQVFQQRDRIGQPHRFYVTSDKELSIEADFTEFGADLNDLRRRLRAGGSELDNDFPKYAARVRRAIGIRSPQAMELFLQTVSMKSVGNLNEFVRNHMLEPADASAKVGAIVAHFEDLTKAHDAVQRARDQLDVLRPLASTSDKYDSALDRRSDAELQRDAIRQFFAELRIGLLDEEIEANRTRRGQRARELADVEQQRTSLGLERERLITARAGAGGQRVNELEQAAATARDQATDRRTRREGFDARVAKAGLSAVNGADEFAALSATSAELSTQLSERRGKVDNEIGELIGRRTALERRGNETRAELESLAGRTSNLPRSQLDVRAELCADLSIDESELPFAGELLDVAEEYAQWRGAAERVLRGFALTLLVPQGSYDRVVRWVNDHRLTHRRNDGRSVGSRLVYERVSERRVRLQRTASHDALLLADTLDIADGPFRDYLHHELLRRADHHCVDSIEEFRSQRRAVTRQGQIRSGDRHEKDDRSRVDDPRSWVLGWVNERKVAALTEQLLEQQQEILDVGQAYDTLHKERNGLGDRFTALANLGVYTSWTELDWVGAQERAEAADAERQRLVDGSSELAEIENRLQENAEQAAPVDGRIKKLNGDVAKLDDRLQRANDARRVDESFLAGLPETQMEAARSSYPSLHERLRDNAPRSAEECRLAADELNDELDTAIKRVNTELGGYAQSLLQYMNEVRRRWPEATTEMDASIDARSEYRAFRDRVEGDDLPRYEEEFKRQLNTNTIRELAQFNNWLRRQAEDIHARVDRINEALGAIDYSTGRYIRLETERTVNQEVQNFRSDLRHATDDTLTPEDDHYSEQRFVDVQRLIERFRGREGHTESDKAWTRRVTDVRNWFTFSASERDRETDMEWEHYRDSDGKSGGQKEKLAYTILAASLAYRFGLEWGASRSRDFRFAVIDEAFGRGSDASTRYALTLFAKLGLQLLIVTPLQKVHVIEPYVRAIGFVDNPTGSYSRLQTLTIEEFQQLRAGHRP